MAEVYGQNTNLVSPQNGKACTEAGISLVLGSMSPCIKEEVIPFDDTVEVSLNLPTTPKRAVLAFIQIEDAAATPGSPPPDPFRVALYSLCDGADPLTVGTYMSHFGAFEVNGGANLTYFRIIGVQPGRTINMRVKYYQ